MITLADIQAKCSPELLASHDYAAIADAVNVGRTKVVERLGGIGTVLTALGPDGGAALLDQLETLAETTPAVKWGLMLIKGDNFDFGLPSSRAMITALVPEPARSALLDIAVVPDPVSAAECEIEMKNSDGSYK